MDLNWTLIAVVAAINFAAALLQASCGFGYAMLAMTLMPLVLPMQTCSAVSAVTVVAIGLQMVLLLRRHIRFRQILLPLCGCFMTTRLGIWCLLHFPEQTLRWILAGLIFLLTGFFFYMQHRSIRLRDKWYCGLGTGLVTGLSTGMFNIVGPFFMVYYASIMDDPLCVKASLECSFLAAGAYATVLHLRSGTFVPEGVPLYAASALAALLAGVIGLRLYRHIDRKMLARVIYVLLPLLAVTLLLRGRS